MLLLSLQAKDKTLPRIQKHYKTLQDSWTRFGFWEVFCPYQPWYALVHFSLHHQSPLESKFNHQTQLKHVFPYMYNDTELKKKLEYSSLPFAQQACLDTC